MVLRERQDIDPAKNEDLMSCCNSSRGIVLAQRQTDRLTEYKRKFRNRLTHIWSFDL